MSRVGMLAMGRMGAAMSARLGEAGTHVLCFTADRSHETQARAEVAGASECASFAELVERSDLLVCIADCDAAEAIAKRVASVAQQPGASGHRPRYVEANPMSSNRLARVQKTLASAGFRLIDASIFGLPPESTGLRPLMVVAGDGYNVLRPLDGVAANLLDIGGEPGDASFIKLLQCGASKGTNALLADLALAAARRDLAAKYFEVLSLANFDLAARLERSLPWMPADADRWAVEMDEIQTEFQSLSATALFAKGTAKVLEKMVTSPLGQETREARVADRTWDETATQLSAQIPRSSQDANPFVLTLFTDCLDEALWGVTAGIDRIGPDLEALGKADRQSHIPSRVSQHDPQIINLLKGRQGQSELFARTDPIHAASHEQIDTLIEAGVTSIMLPYFFDAGAVETFVNIVDGRARTTLLCETVPALFRLPEVLSVPGVDEVHFGLTDLMLSSGVGSRFEVLCSDVLMSASEIVHRADKPLHIGGIASITDDSLPLSADLTLARYIQLGASGSLVTRAFLAKCRGRQHFVREISLFKDRVGFWQRASPVQVSAAVAELQQAMRELRESGKNVP